MPEKPKSRPKVLPKNLKSSKKVNKVVEPKKIKPEVITHKIDASDQILGRLSTRVADLLRGKGKPTFRPNILMGDKVLITNAAKIKVTGTNKMIQKKYYRHSGYLGNLKSQTMADLMRVDPSRIILHAVSGMLPKNKLRKEWLKNLTILNGEKNG
ncbi:MAG: 50S ribosomal protein L13 [Patescibacteria group bacterium]|jgi:large subunit ribosomal protein L13